MHDQLLDMLLKKDEITWQDLIYDLVKSEKMDPWDIDVSILAKKYLETLKQLKETNFFISGRVILAAAILLKIKSHNLISEKLRAFDATLFYSPEQEQIIEQLSEEEPQMLATPRLTIKTPLTRKRKVLLKDLVKALEEALEVESRRKRRIIAYQDQPEDLKIPERKVDIGEVIKSLYEKITNFFKTKKEKLTFAKLIPSQKKEDVIATFIPLLHLDTQNKINIEQEIPFGEISIELK